MITIAEKTFIKITNKDIYDSIVELKEENTKQHNAIIKHQIKTNGKVKTNRWIATTAMTLTLITLGYVIKIIGG